MKALTPLLRESCESYYEAFRMDLNHYYSGLNALQMATLLLDLSKQEDRWNDMFDTDAKAEECRKELEERADSLRSLMPLVVEGALRRISCNDKERPWAEISKADLLFLADPDRPRRAAMAYVAAISNPFDWNAARGQLQLFADLGVHAGAALEIIQKVEAELRGTPSGTEKAPKPEHLIVFAGHRIDTPGREPRFPAEKENDVRALIREQFEGLLDDEHAFVALGSGAAGTDILAHEVCDELGIKSVMCLPMPAKDAAARVFQGLDNWRDRFLNLVKSKREVLHLSDREGLPRWLTGSDADPWERGNRWVMKLAETWGAEKVYLVALYDGKPYGDAPGGTAQIVRLAEDSGMIQIRRIDANLLLL